MTTDVFDPTDLDDMRSMNVQAAMSPGATVELGPRQWATLPDEQRPPRSTPCPRRPSRRAEPRR